MSDSETRMQERVDGKLVEPDDREAAVTQVEHRIWMAVMKELCQKWTEDEATAKDIEALRSDVARLSAKMADDVVCMNSGHGGKSRQPQAWKVSRSK